MQLVSLAAGIKMIQLLVNGKRCLILAFQSSKAANTELGSHRLVT
jgi:hypothetical protein